MRRRRIKKVLLVSACCLAAFTCGVLIWHITHEGQEQDSGYYITDISSTAQIVHIPPAGPVPVDHETRIIRRENPKLHETEVMRLWEFIDLAFASLDEIDNMTGGAVEQISRPVAIAVMLQESKGNPKAKGKAGEIGLFQVTPKYHTTKLHKAGILETSNAAELWEPEKNALAGVYLLKQCAAGVPTLDRALMRYNAGYMERNGAGYWRKIKPLIVELEGGGELRDAHDRKL